VYAGKSLKDAEAHTRWRIMSGLVELSSASLQVSGQPAKRFAVDISELTAGYGTKRGDGAVRLQFLRVPIGSRLGSATAPSMAANNLPARMFDVKTPGTWVDASDGPRVTANGSYMGYCFLHAGDDNIKVDSAHSIYEHLTLVQGNIGSAIELATYGIGIRENTVENVRIYGIYIHRVTQSGGMDDNLGALLGSRTCPWGITLKDISIHNVYVPNAMGNVVDANVKFGTYGRSNYRFNSRSNLDRWYFCSNAWWLDDQHILDATPTATAAEAFIHATSAPPVQAARFINLNFTGWQVMVPAAGASWIYNFHLSAGSTFDNVVFDSDRIDGLTDLSGVRVLL